MDVRGSRFLALTVAEDCAEDCVVEENKGSLAGHIKDNENNAEKSGADQRSIKTTKSKPIHRAVHVAERRVFKENINVNNLQISTEAANITHTKMRTGMQTDMTAHQHMMESYHTIHSPR